MGDILVRNVSKTFEGGALHSKVVAVDNVSCEIAQGEFLCIIGPSGCGKTTLLHMLAGFTGPSSGEVVSDGKVVTQPGPERIVMFQEYGLFPWMTVAENIEFGLEAKGLPREERRSLVAHYVNLVGLTGFENRYPRHISGGMKQRVSIARALAPDPQAILMDEPFAALDSLTRDVMQEEILSIWGATKKTFVLITHNIDEAIFLGDRVLVMTHRPGRIKEMLKIELPRPRDASIRSSDRQFLQYREHLANSLRKEVRSFVDEESNAGHRG
ncbi:MAG: ABC transporter ATP-binding protein [Usitatibacter sp.]